MYSFNLALPATPLAPHYFMLKDYLKNNLPPKYIILKFTPGGFNSQLFPYYAVINAGFSEVLQYSFLRKDADVLVNYMLPWRFYWPEIKRYIISKGIALLPARFRKMIKEHYASPQFFDLRYVNVEASARAREELLRLNRGYYYIAEQAIVNGVMPDNVVKNQKEDLDRGISRHRIAEQTSLAQIQDPFVDKFFNLCGAKGIKVILISDYSMGSSRWFECCGSLR